MFRVEVLADDSGIWAGNALKFETEAAAQDYARDLWSRWTAVRAWRVVRQDDDAVMVSGKS
jgi:hypothetical protein